MTAWWPTSIPGSHKRVELQTSMSAEETTSSGWATPSMESCSSLPSGAVVASTWAGWTAWLDVRASATLLAQVSPSRTLGYIPFKFLWNPWNACWPVFIWNKETISYIFILICFTFEDFWSPNRFEIHRHFRLWENNRFIIWSISINSEWPTKDL